MSAIPGEAEEGRTPGPAEETSPVIEEVEAHPKDSAIALVGHPIHAMMVHFPIALVIATLGADLFYWYGADPFWLRVGVWSAGFAFWTAVAASVVGTVELLLVRGIRVRVASWAHATAAMTLVAVVGTNWGLRLADPEAALPEGLVLSALGSVFAGLAGWHGGKLVFDHGIGIMVSPHR